MNWKSELVDDRSRKEVQFAKVYAEMFSHGTDGHNRLLLIDAMARILDRLEKENMELVATVTMYTKIKTKPSSLDKLENYAEKALARTENGAYEGSSAHDMWQTFLRMIDSAKSNTLEEDYDDFEDEDDER